MALSHQNTNSFTFFSFLHFLFLAIPISCNSFPSFGYTNFRNGSNSEAHISLYGDAKVDQNGSFVQVTTPNKFSSGRVMFKKAIKLNDGTRKTSFSTCFSFSLSQENGDGLAFVIVPHGYSTNGYDGTLFGLSNELSNKTNRPLVIEFDTKVDQNYGDLNGNHVGVDVGRLVSVKVANVSNVKLVLSSGEKLQSWIDYEATSKRLEIRLSKYGKTRPVDPLLSCLIDLSAMFNNKSVFIGLSSSNSNSSQVCKLYSWSFKLRQVPYWMHSQPLDPESFSKDSEPVRVDKRSGCVVRFVTALIFGTGCGALGAFIALWVWTMFVNKKPVAPEEFVVRPIKCECDKSKNFLAEKSVKDDGFKCVA